MEKYQVLPPLSDEEYESLKADIAERGVQVPVEYDQEGNILDGYHRVRVCRELGITDWPKVVRRGLSEAEKRAHARKLNLNRRHLSREQRRALIAEALREAPERSDRQHATALGVDHKTVGTVRQESERRGEIPHVVSRLDALGRQQPSERKAEAPTPVVHPSPAKVEDEQTEEAPVKEAEFSPEPVMPVSTVPHVAHNSGNNEWYTPPEYIEAARKVMGAIDLDPASSVEANKVVGATLYFTAEDDGLAQPWAGRVWLNPPYAQPLVAHFAEKLAAHIADGSVSQACVLVNNATETGWFQLLARHSAAICFPKGRVRFWHPERESAPLQGQAVLYMGENAGKFREEFERFGFVMVC